MAFGDFLDLSQAACRAAQFDPTDTTGDLVRGKAAINEAHMRVCSSGDPWDFLEREGQWKTVAGSDVYSYSSIATAMSITGASIREIHSLTIDADGGGLLLASCGWRDLERFAISTQESSEGTGAPVIWAKWASRIRLYPSPDQAYTIGAFCYLTPNELTLDTDTPLLPLAHRHAVLVPYAAAVLVEQEGGGDAGVQHDRLMNRHREGLVAMRASNATAKRPTFSPVAPGFFEARTEPTPWVVGW